MSEIDTTQVYKQLKKQNGEAFARVIRDAVLLDVPNIVHILEFAGNNPKEAQELVPVIRELFKTPKSTEKYHTTKNPLELLDEAGYDAFVVETEEQKDSIKKYFRPGEQLCTFQDRKRHKDFYIIHAIKRGADKIKPSKTPNRQDEYGTSVISIQIAKTGGFISIKNRYNHSVNNPDATFWNNPDEIIHGLTESLRKFFKVDFLATEIHHLSDNFIIVQDQLVRFNYEFAERYIGKDFYCFQDKITRLDTDYQIIMDIFILDTRYGDVYTPAFYDFESFVFRRFFEGKKIKIEKNPNNKDEKIISVNGIKVAHIQNGIITELYLPGIKKVDNKFLEYNTTLKSLSMPDLEECGNYFLYHNTTIEKLHLPRIKYVGKGFMNSHKTLKNKFMILSTEKPYIFRFVMNKLKQKVFSMSKTPVIQY
ncbi:MAG: hypothetical protein IKN73_04530 [Alphaproteobacteria bacterium]|nr:hypothetical protein [Alphaproteobacteria bacterium]